MSAIVLRETANRPLTWQELDNNWKAVLEMFAAIQGDDVPVEAPAGRILTNADYGRVLNCNAATLQTFTLAAGLTQGFRCAIVQAGVGQVQVDSGSAVLVNVDGHYKSSGAGAVLTVINTSTDAYVLGGNTAA